MLAVDESCGPGLQRFDRYAVRSKPIYLGDPELCPKMTKYELCGVDCECLVSAWSSWTCLAPPYSCQTGQKTRTRTITQAPYGDPLPACPDLIQTAPCQAVCCTVQWTAWSACDSLSCVSTRSTYVGMRVPPFFISMAYSEESGCPSIVQEHDEKDCCPVPPSRPHVTLLSLPH